MRILFKTYDGTYKMLALMRLLWLFLTLTKLLSMCDDTVDDDDDTGDDGEAETHARVAPQCGGCCRGCCCCCQSWLPCRSCTARRSNSPPNQQNEMINFQLYLHYCRYIISNARDKDISIQQKSFLFNLPQVPAASLPQLASDWWRYGFRLSLVKLRVFIFLKTMMHQFFIQFNLWVCGH